jgi:integrase
MEARQFKFTTNYRYKPVNGKPINLGNDKMEAIRQVLDMTKENSDFGTLNELWRIYQSSADFKKLAADSRKDYVQCSVPLLKVFGKMAPSSIEPHHIYYYLETERKDAQVRANREKSLLSNLFNTAIKRGQLKLNPCKQVSKNTENPRKQSPTPKVLSEFLDWAWSQKGQGMVLAGMTEFASIAGNRGVEFRTLSWTQIGATEIRIIRAKQKGAEVVEVIEIEGMIADLIARLRKLAKDDRHGWVFPNSQGNAYTAQAFKLGFARLKAAARKAGKFPKNFTMHDLRHYFVTAYKLKNKVLPELHADPATTARIYNDSKEVNRKGL